MNAVSQTENNPESYLLTGIVRVDITPDGPIRLAGHGDRQTESEGVLQRLEAKALAFGSDEEGPSLFITVDLIGIPGYITAGLRDYLSDKTGLNPANLVISVSHTLSLLSCSPLWY